MNLLQWVAVHDPGAPISEAAGPSTETACKAECLCCCRCSRCPVPAAPAKGNALTADYFRCTYHLAGYARFQPPSREGTRELKCVKLPDGIHTRFLRLIFHGPKPSSANPWRQLVSVSLFFHRKKRCSRIVFASLKTRLSSAGSACAARDVSLQGLRALSVAGVAPGIFCCPSFGRGPVVGTWFRVSGFLAAAGGVP